MGWPAFRLAQPFLVEFEGIGSRRKIAQIERMTENTERLRGVAASLESRLTERNGKWFDGVGDKLDRWTADRRATLEVRRDEAWKTFDLATREVDKQKGALLDTIDARRQQKTELQDLFTIRWTLR